MIKKKVQISVVLVFLLFMGSIFTVTSISAYGMEAAVQTNGEIVFTEDSTKPTVETSEPTVNSSDTPVTKPTGKFPSTGELVAKSLGITGIAVLIFALLFYLFKRKKADDGKDGQGQ